MSNSSKDSGMFTASGQPSSLSAIPLRDIDPRNPQHASIGTLVKDATSQVSTLVRAEVELAKTEVSEQVKRGLAGSVFFIVAAVLALTSLPVFAFFAAKLISMWFGTPSWDWIGFLIVFLVLLGLAGVFALLGYLKVKRVQKPERTLSSAQNIKTVLPGQRPSDADLASRAALRQS